MSWLGPLIGAAGQIGGGLLAADGSKVNPDDIMSSYYNPAMDYALQAAQFDALNQIGWGALGNVPDPFQQIAGQIQNVPLDSKTRNRALQALMNIKRDPTLLDDPYGAQFTRDQVFEANKTGEVPFGRVVTRGPEGSGVWSGGGLSGHPLFPGNTPIAKPILNAFGVKGDTMPTGLPIEYIGRLENALGSAGLSLADLAKKVKEQQEFEAKIARLKAAGLPQMAEQMVIDRAKTTSTAAALSAAGADYARSGASQNPLFMDLIAQDNRNLDRFATRAGLQANFGGISPAAAQKSITDAELDQNLRVLEHALGASGALQATMAPGTAAAQGTTSGQSNAAQIAAQQAAAANALRVQGRAAGADSFGNAIGAASSTIGSYLSNQALTKQLNSSGGFPSYEGGGYGPGSTANQLATPTATWNPNVFFG